MKTAMIIGNSNEHGFMIGEEVVVGGFHSEYIKEDHGYVKIFRCYSVADIAKRHCEKNIYLVREYDIAG